MTFIVFFKRFWITGLMLLTLTQICQAFPLPEGAKVENVTDIGFGFQKVTFAIPNSWEIGYHTFLFYRDQEICRLGICSVSPSGNYVIYQDGPSGNLFLYRRADSHKFQLTHFTAESVPIVVGFVWDEEDRIGWRYDSEFRRIQEIVGAGFD